MIWFNLVWFSLIWFSLIYWNKCGEFLLYLWFQAWAPPLANGRKKWPKPWKSWSKPKERRRRWNTSSCWKTSEDSLKPWESPFISADTFETFLVWVNKKSACAFTFEAFCLSLPVTASSSVLRFQAVTKELFDEALRALADEDYLTVTGKTVRLLAWGSICCHVQSWIIHPDPVRFLRQHVKRVCIIMFSDEDYIQKCEDLESWWRLGQFYC